MKRYLTIIVLAISLLISCRATKVKTEEITEVKTHVSNVDSMQRQVEFSGTTLSSIVSSVTLNSNSELSQTRTVYSPPDSLGRQYPLEVTESRLNSNVTEQSASKLVDQSSLEISDTTSQSTSQLASQIVSEKSEFKETPKGQGWKAWAAIIISLGLVLLAYLVLKRIRLIK